MIEFTEPAELSGEQRAVLGTLDRLLAAVAGRDPDAMRELLLPDGAATQSRDGEFWQVPLSELPDRFPPGPAQLEERFLNPLVLVDDNIAVVWAPYDFLTDGTVHHWGTNILTFLNMNEDWRVSGVADNGRSGPRLR